MESISKKFFCVTEENCYRKYPNFANFYFAAAMLQCIRHRCSNHADIGGSLLLVS